MSENRPAPGLTAASMMACVLCMLAMGMLIQYSDITIGVPFASEHTLALPAIWVFAALAGVCGVVFLLTRWRILSRAEMLCVMFCMLISAPLMTQGFWHRIVSILATNPRMADFEKLDAMNDRLWPHGPNETGGAFDPANPALRTEGGCRWEDIEYDAGRRRVLPVLVNAAGDAESRILLRLPVARDGAPGMVPAEPYIVSVLAKATEMGPATRYTCRVRADGAAEFTEFFSSAEPPKVNFLHRTGFRRVGAYGVKFPAEARDYYTLEFALRGNGRLELAEPKLFNVAALESIYRGRLLVTESEYAAMPAAERAGTVVKPDRMWSLRGLAFLAAGYIPVRDWAGPVRVWTLFVVLLLSAILAINVILRRQWLDNERFQMPAARIPAALIGEPDEGPRAMAPIWTHRMMHAGFVAALAWTLLKVWHFYNPNVPDAAVKIYLAEYFHDPGWGQMWSRWRFEIEGIFLSMCVFMELNVLLSLVLGYVLFRSQFWLGELFGLTVDPNYPYGDAQGIGAYLGYAAILLVLSRKYLWRTLRAAVSGDRVFSAGEALSYRGAYGLLALSVAGSVLWARWLGIASGSMLVYFGFLVTTGLVASRLRAECGTPWGYFIPWNLALFLGLLGGVWRFGPEAMMFCYLAGFMLGPTVFYLIPGAQMELLGLGRRWNVTPRHLIGCALLGAIGGMLIGGWVFLSNGYAMGGDTSRYQWAFDSKWWYFFPYNQDLTAANNRMLGQAAAAAGGGVDGAWTALGLSAAISVALTALRQMFSGFWFHPVGFVLGSTDFMNYIWGSALTAWAVRALALRLGGAAAVRNRLQPFFVGVFLGTCSGYLFVMIQSAYLRAAGVQAVYPLLTP